MKTDVLDSPVEVCQMCEKVHIRFVHIMSHPEAPEAPPLRCGCVCAGHMEEDLLGARNRERALKKAAKNRASWVKRWLKRPWHPTATGAEYIRIEGYHVSVWPRADGTYNAKVEDKKSGVTIYAPLTRKSMDLTKVDMLEILQRMKS
jgi:hypothetical protein